MLLPQSSSSRSWETLPNMNTIRFESCRSSQGADVSSPARRAWKLPIRWFVILVSAGLLFTVNPSQAALVDQWLAENLATLNDGDAVGSWTSASNRTVAAGIGLQPSLRKNVTP